MESPIEPQSGPKDRRPSGEPRTPEPTPSRPAAGAKAGATRELAPGLRVAESALNLEFLSGSGPGGQNVNRRSMRARLRVAVGDLGLSPAAASRLRALSGSRYVASSDEIVLSSSEERSQKRNTEACFARLRLMLIEARTPPKIRRKTKPSAGSVRRRLEAKKQRSERKQGRKPPRRDD